MIKVQKVSKGKVQNMMSNGAFKRELTYRNIMGVEEFLKAEVGCELEPGEMSIDPCYGAMMIEEGFFYKGKEYHLIHLTFKGEIVLVGRHGGLKVKWKSTLGYVETYIEENGKIYDTKTAKLINRRTIAIKEKPFDAVFFDFYQTYQGDYFTHVVSIVMQDIADEMMQRDSLSKKEARYIGIIKPVSKEEIIEEFGSMKKAQKIFDESAPPLHKILFDESERPCETCGGC